MRSLPSDPDIQTIVTRIESTDLDLQPAFQRGEVWSRAKKQRLIDTILRDWHVPPIHVIESPDNHKQEVLDGQQRLAAIRDFVFGEFPVDGHIEPVDSAIMALHNLRYRELPASWRRRFDQFTIRVFRIVDYLPSEPGELFFRLNQPTSLTAAEQRNAYFGPVRQQVKKLVGHLTARDLGKELLGFSNSRMAYDDVLARVALTIERGSLAAKVTSASLANLYRGEDPLSEKTTSCIDRAIDLLGDAKPLLEKTVTGSFNKATLYSVFLFIARANNTSEGGLTPEVLSGFLGEFETQRVFEALVGDQRPFVKAYKWSIPPDRLISIYDDRSSSRVADVSSVLLRDSILWTFFGAYQSWAAVPNPWFDQIERLRSTFVPINAPFDEDVMARALVDSGWGKLP